MDVKKEKQQTLETKETREREKNIYTTLCTERQFIEFTGRLYFIGVSTVHKTYIQFMHTFVMFSLHMYW